MEKQKHILFISSWHPNRNNPTHGIFNQYFSEAAQLFNKVSVLHVCSDGLLGTDQEMVESTENNITTLIVYYKKITSKIPVLSHFKKREKLIAAFENGYNQLIKKTGKPDLIQLNIVMPAGIGVHYLCNKHQIPYIINEGWSGYTSEDGAYRGFFLKLFTRKIIKGAKTIMPTSDYLKEAMLKHDLNGSYIVIPNVVNTELFKPLDNNLSANETNFVHISSLNEREKNVTGIIHAFAKALKENSNIKLNIVGEGKEKQGLQQLVTNLGIESKIFFKGRLNPPDLAKEINNNDALLMFSNYETFSLVIIEAFACGKPVITSDAGAIKSYMKPEFGIMVNKKDEAQLCQAILKFSINKNSFNASYIREYAVNNYSYNEIGKKLNEIYENAILKTEKMKEFIAKSNITV